MKTRNNLLLALIPLAIGVGCSLMGHATLSTIFLVAGVCALVYTFNKRRTIRRKRFRHVSWDGNQVKKEA